MKIQRNVTPTSELAKRFILLLLYFFKVLIESFVMLLLFGVLIVWLWGIWDLNSPTRDQTCTSCIGRWSLNHWTARAVLGSCVFIKRFEWCYALAWRVWRSPTSFHLTRFSVHWQIIGSHKGRHLTMDSVRDGISLGIPQVALNQMVCSEL